jgi:hypothetical protein
MGDSAKIDIWKWAYRKARVSIWKARTQNTGRAEVPNGGRAARDQRRSQRSASGRNRGKGGDVLGSWEADSRVNEGPATRSGVRWGPTCHLKKGWKKRGAFAMENGGHRTEAALTDRQR